MEVILLRDVPQLGKKFSVVRVKDGFGRNYLLPRGLAKTASDAAITQAQSHAKLRVARMQELETQAKEIAQKLKNFTLTIRKKGTSAGHLYGSVSAQDVIQGVSDELKVRLEPEIISITKPIKVAGKTKVTARLTSDVDAHFIVSVEVDTTKR